MKLLPGAAPDLRITREGEKAAVQRAKQQTKKRQITNKKTCLCFGPPAAGGPRESPRDLAQEGSKQKDARQN